jgi:regulation of enolase protein 1 (concanavalin A-like superfamily)
MTRGICLLVCLIAVTAANGAEAANRTVCASGCQHTTVQGAIDAAAPGDVILLRAGQTFTGNIVLRAKSSTATAYITIRSDAADSMLPAPGVRLIPEGKSGANVTRGQLARLIGVASDRAAPVIRTEAGAHHYLLQFLDIDGVSSQGYYTLIALGENSTSQTLSNAPHHITFDRVYAHGHPTVGQQRGVALNGRDMQIVNSYLSDFFSVDESQAIAGFNGAGPFLIENNFLEGATENVMFGGSDPKTANVVPSDIVIRGNYLYKRTAWQNAAINPPATPSATATTGGVLGAGTHYFKVVAGLRTGGNEVVSAPSGQAIATVGSGGAVRLTWTGVSNAAWYRVYRGTVSNGQKAYVDTTATSFTYTGSGEHSGTPRTTGTKWSIKNLLELKNARRVTIESNLFENNWQAGQTGVAILFTPRNQEGTAPWSVVRDVTFTRNIVRRVASAIVIQGRDDEHSSQQAVNFRIANNLFEDVSTAYGGSGQFFVVTSSPAGVVIDHNTILNNGTVVIADNGAVSGFVYTNNLSKHNEYGIFGSGAGLGISALGTYFPGYVFAKNVLAGGPAASYPSGNYFPSVTTFNASFVDPANGNYTLVSTSPYRGAGTDGKDIGVDHVALQVARAARTSASSAGGGATGGSTGGSSGGGTTTLPAGWLGEDIGVVGAAGSSSAVNGTFSVRGAGADIWGTADAFHFTYRQMTGDGTIVARVASLSGSEAWTKAGVMIRTLLTAESAHALMLVSRQKGVAFQRRRSAGATSVNTTFNLDAAPLWVKVTRAGSVVTAYLSYNGTSWALVGSDTISLTNTVYVGLAVTNHTTAQTALGTFDNVSVTQGTQALPSGWSTRDVGPVGPTGSANYSGGIFTVKGAGADIWGNSDAFRYAYRTLTADGTIVARVSSLTGSESWTKAGVMMRQTLDAGSAQAMMLVSRGSGLAFQRRTVTGGTSAHTSGGAGTAPVWLKLSRSGPVVTASVSSDGASWRVVGSTSMSFSGAIYVGLAVTSHSTSVVATGVFDSVTVTP